MKNSPTTKTYHESNAGAKWTNTLKFVLLVNVRGHNSATQKALFTFASCERSLDCATLAFFCGCVSDTGANVPTQKSS